MFGAAEEHAGCSCYGKIQGRGSNVEHEGLTGRAGADLGPPHQLYQADDGDQRESLSTSCQTLPRPGMAYRIS